MYDLKGNTFKLYQVYNFSETGIIVNAWSIHINSTINLLRTFARKFSNIDFFLKILPLKDDELVMSEM